MKSEEEPWKPVPIIAQTREVSYDEAIDEAAKILAISKRPLLYGWASASCEVHEKKEPRLGFAL